MSSARARGLRTSVAAWAAANDGAASPATSTKHHGTPATATAMLPHQGPKWSNATCNVKRPDKAHLCGVSYADAAAMKSFDWRDHGAVTPVKNQGAWYVAPPPPPPPLPRCRRAAHPPPPLPPNSGACWTFSTTGDLEGSLYLGSQNATSTLVGLSEQQLVACNTQYNMGCDGGDQRMAMEYVAAAGGLVAQTQLQYRRVDSAAEERQGPTCPEYVTDSLESGHVAATVASWVTVSKGGGEEHKLRQALLYNGPLAVSLDATPMQTYVSGVADPDDCSSDAADLDHAVLLVGWGRQSGKDYWIVKNSWGAAWGEAGYYKLKAGANKCGIADTVVHAVVGARG